MLIEDPLRAALEMEGHRMTAPRRAVWDVVSAADRHLTADEIAARVRVEDPDINLSSVYRSLALFSELGLVRESSLVSGGPSHWEPAHPDNEFHLHCRSCGKVDHHRGDEVDRVRQHLEAQHGWVAERVELLVTGLCSDCA